MASTSHHSDGDDDDAAEDDAKAVASSFDACSARSKRSFCGSYRSSRIGSINKLTFNDSIHYIGNEQHHYSR
jgi:hypothetical protein